MGQVLFQLQYPKSFESYLKELFANSTFNCGPPIPAMKIPPTHIHLKKNAILYACHVPILIPHHWNAQVKSRTDADIQKDVITEVPTCAPKT